MRRAGTDALVFATATRGCISRRAGCKARGGAHRREATADEKRASAREARHDHEPGFVIRAVGRPQRRRVRANPARASSATRVLSHPRIHRSLKTQRVPWHGITRAPFCRSVVRACQRLSVGVADGLPGKPGVGRIAVRRAVNRCIAGNRRGPLILLLPCREDRTSPGRVM